MRTKDIEIGKEYAQSRSTDAYLTNRVRVNAKGVFRRTGWRTNQGKQDGIEVTLLDDKTGEPLLDNDGEPRTTIVRAATIRDEWDVYAARKAEAEAARKRMEQAARERRADAKATLQDLLPVDDSDLPYPFRGGSWENYGTISMDLPNIARLAKAIADEARRQALDEVGLV